MKELLENAKEFRESGIENLEKKRYNVSASDFFKSIVIFCDYLIYNQINYNLKMNLKEVLLLKEYSDELERIIKD